MAATFLSALSVRAQVTVRLQQPPPNQLKVADMWKITIINNARQARRVYLQGTATEARDGQVIDAQSAQFDLPPGTKMITGRDVEPVKANSSNSKYKNIVLQTGTVPSGEYTICVYVKDAKTGETLGSDCIVQTVQNVSLVLIAPQDEGEVSQELPQFVWTTTPLMGGGAKYTVRIVEILGNQTPYNAMQSRGSFYEKEGVPGVTFQYPVSAPKLVSGKNYAWQVTAYSNGVKVSESEVWKFTYGSSTIVVAPPKDLKLKIAAKFEKAYGGSGRDAAYCVREAKDSGYVLAGYTTSFGGGQDDAYLVKTDPGGTLEWSQTYGGDNDEAFYGVDRTQDGGYIAVGYTRSFDTPNSDAFVVKVDAKGNLQWSKTIGGGSNDAAYSVAQTDDGGYIVAGVLGTGDDYDAYLIRLNGNGSVRWARNFGGMEYDIFKSVRQTRGGFIAAGYTRSYGLGNDDAYVVFVDEEGTLQWATSIGNQLVDRGYSIVEPHGTMFVIVGYTLDDQDNGFDLFMTAVGRSGERQWGRTYHVGPIDEGAAATATKEGEVIAAGYTRGGSMSQTGGVYLVKVNIDGAVQWSRLYQGSAPDAATAVDGTSDHGFIVAGWASGIEGGDALLIKTDSQGNAGCDETDPKTNATPARISSASGSLFGLGANLASPSSSAAPATTVETPICPK